MQPVGIHRLVECDFRDQARIRIARIDLNPKQLSGIRLRHDERAAARFDLAAHGVTYNAFFGPMYTVYLRGEAFLATSQPADALREFERITAHRGIVLADPIDAFARLQRARILAAANTADARRAYEDLLAIWVNGDANVPLLERAKAAYAALR